MNLTDLIIFIPVAIGFILGLFRGLVKELIALAAIFLGIYGAKFLSPWLAGILTETFSFTQKTAQPVAYIFLFIAIVIIMLILARMIDKLFDAVSLGGLNRFLGGIFGGLKFLLIVSVLINVFDAIDAKFSLVKPETIQNSLLYKPVLKVAPELWNEIRERYQHNDELNESNQVSNI